MELELARLRTAGWPQNDLQPEDHGSKSSLQKVRLINDV
jgi:hypothetical protein